MIKVPAKHRRSIETELKRFLPVFSNLAAKGKASSEDDARIILNDVLSYVLGYDKYNELKTEQRDKGGRLDYLVTLADGPRRKRASADFIVEAKAAHITLNQSHVDQTLAYCLTAGLDFFFLTNVLTWQLYKVKRSKKQPEAFLIHEVNFTTDNSAETLAEDFYIFSKASYLAGDWNDVSLKAKATNEGDIVAILLSDRMIKLVVRQLKEIHGARLSDEVVKDIIENKIIKAENNEINKGLLRRLNQKPSRRSSQAGELPNETEETAVEVTSPVTIGGEENKNETESTKQTA